MSFVLAETGRDPIGPTVKVFPPSSKECRDKKDNSKKKTIVCVASKFYPDHVSVSWELNGEAVTKGVATDNVALREGEYYTITSRLRVSAEQWYTPSNNFSCIVNFYKETGPEPQLKSIFGQGTFIWSSEMTQT